MYGIALATSSDRRSRYQIGANVVRMRVGNVAQMGVANVVQSSVTNDAGSCSVSARISASGDLAGRAWTAARKDSSEAIGPHRHADKSETWTATKDEPGELAEFCRLRILSDYKRSTKVSGGRGELRTSSNYKRSTKASLARAPPQRTRTNGRLITVSSRRNTAR